MSFPPFRSRTSTRFSVAARSCVLVAAIVFLAAPAVALDFQVDFRSSTYQVVAGDTFSDLLAQHQSETLIQSNTVEGLENISTAVHGGGISNDYSVLMQTTLAIGVAGEYTFQVGTDWGRGGATALIDNNTSTIVSELVITDDIWWNYDWNNSDVFTTTFDFEVGDSYTIAWVGFEGCCGGSSTLRFSIDGAPYTPLTSPNIDPVLVPEPSTAMLLMLGLLCLGVDASRER